MRYFIYTRYFDPLPSPSDLFALSPMLPLFHLFPFFNFLDKNNDGSISMEELEASLRHVAVKCPTSRCVYRCDRKVAHELFERIAGQGER